MGGILDSKSPTSYISADFSYLSRAFKSNSYAPTTGLGG